MNTCMECRFWRRDEVQDGMADCQLFSDDPNIEARHKWPKLIAAPERKAFVAPDAGADGGCLVTRSDFGCVQFDPISA